MHEKVPDSDPAAGEMSTSEIIASLMVVMVTCLRESFRRREMSEISWTLTPGWFPVGKLDVVPCFEGVCGCLSVLVSP